MWKKTNSIKISQKMLIALFCSCIMLTARAETSSSSSSSFTEWRQQTLNQFQAYKEARDREFVDSLAKQWTVVQARKGLVRDVIPKPVIIPIASVTPLTELPDDSPRQIDIPNISIEPLVDLRPDKPILPTPSTPYYSIQIDFYGQALSFNVTKSMELKLKRTVNAKSIADAWKALSKSDYENLVFQLETQASNLQLGDWAKLKLVQHLVEQMPRLNLSEQTLVNWFLLSKLDFDTRITYQNNRLYLFLASQHTLYATKFMTVKGVKYYFIGNNSSESLPQKFFTYDAIYDNARHAMDLSFDKVANFSEKLSVKTLAFQWQQSDFELNIPVDQNRIAFYQSYPQVDLYLYFQSGPTGQAKQQLVKQLAPLLKGKNEKEAVNLILKLVQTSLTYATDGQQFGEENYLLPDETLFYPASDCEDRAVLFSWLVRELLGLDVIGLNYPGHIATAIAFNGKVSGDSVYYKGRKYILADPTYVNARVGMTMPAYQGVNALVISAQ